MKFAIISHTDPDGWMSAAVVLRYINSKHPGTEVTCFSYNYGGDTKNIKDKMDELIDSGEGLLIFITDVTLPDDFMSKYAKYIWHIDHHKSVIEKHEDWWDKLYKEDSAITVEGYKDTNSNQAEQVAACELCWLILFPNTEMPEVVRLTGRYDIWDHPKDNKTYDLYNYYNSRIPDAISAKHNAQLRYLEPWFNKLFTKEGLEQALKEGKEAGEWKDIFDACSVLKGAAITKCFDRIIALCNISANSLYFKELIRRHPNIEGMMPFYYSPFKNQWKISCYQVEGKDNFKALEFLQQFKEHVEVLDIGGHENACGMSIDNDNIKTFLECFTLYKEKNL